MKGENNTFFTKDIYDTEIELEVNLEVLERIYGDNVKPTDMLPIEFAFVTDKETKAIIFKDYLIRNFPEYANIRIGEYDDYYEVTGVTPPILMDITAINEWNKLVWDIGYEYDCKLDGWQVGV